MFTLTTVEVVGELGFWYGPAFYAGASATDFAAFPWVASLVRGVLASGLLLLLPSKSALRTVAAAGAVFGALVFVPQLRIASWLSSGGADSFIIFTYVSWAAFTVGVWASASVLGWLAGSRVATSAA